MKNGVQRFSWANDETSEYVGLMTKHQNMSG